MSPAALLKKRPRPSSSYCTTAVPAGQRRRPAMLETSQLILASGSRARYSLLKSAGVAFTVIPADIDETAVRETLTSDNPEIDPVDIADVLARVKGEAVSAANPD